MNDMEWDRAGRPVGPPVAATSAACDGGSYGGGVSFDEDEVAVAQSLFWDYIKDLRKHQQELVSLQAAEIDPARLKKAVEAARTVRDAIQLLMVERNKVDKLRKDIAGGVAGGCLDLDAARDEIGRRLACLRRAGGG